MHSHSRQQLFHWERNQNSLGQSEGIGHNPKPWWHSRGLHKRFILLLAFNKAITMEITQHVRNKNTLNFKEKQRKVYTIQEKIVNPFLEWFRKSPARDKRVCKKNSLEFCASVWYG